MTKDCISPFYHVVSSITNRRKLPSGICNNFFCANYQVDAPQHDQSFVTSRLLTATKMPAPVQGDSLGCVHLKRRRQGSSMHLHAYAATSSPDNLPTVTSDFKW